MYPSGQLLKGSDPNHPPSSTIGPRLESALLNSYYRNQLPHYVLAKNRRTGIESDTELFDPLYESDEIVDDYYSGGMTYSGSSPEGVVATSSDTAEEEPGLIPRLIRTATDDLKLVGNVIKLALS